MAEYLAGSLVRCFIFLGKMVTLVAKLVWEIRAAIPFESSATRREPLVPKFSFFKARRVKRRISILLSTR